MAHKNVVPGAAEPEPEEEAAARDPTAMSKLVIKVVGVENLPPDTKAGDPTDPFALVTIDGRLLSVPR